LILLAYCAVMLDAPMLKVSKNADTTATIRHSFLVWETDMDNDLLHHVPGLPALWDGPIVARRAGRWSHLAK
jgi:hypothetical protein